MRFRAWASGCVLSFAGRGRALWLAAALLLSGCRPELTYFFEFRPNRVLLDGPQTTLRFDAIRPHGYLGPINVEAELQSPDGLPLMGPSVARVKDPVQEKLSNEIDVSLDSVIATSEVLVLARGECEGEKREAKATLDLSLLGSYTITSEPPAPVNRGAPATIDVEATGFNVEGLLELELRITMGQVVLAPGKRATYVTTKGRNNWPIARSSYTFDVPQDATAPLKATIQGRLYPRAPLIVVGANQLKEFELRVNE